MDDLANSTQRFNVEHHENDETEVPSMSYNDQSEEPDTAYATQAFAEADHATGYEDDSNYDGDEPGSVHSTQAFGAGNLDDGPSDDPMLYESDNVVIDSTQQFAVAEFSTVDSQNVVNTSVTSDGDYALLTSDSQPFVGGLEIIETTGDFSGNYGVEEQEVACEEVVEGDEVLSNADDFGVDEIASPDPVDEGDEIEDDEEQDEAKKPARKRGNRFSSGDEQEEDEEQERGSGQASTSRTSKVYINDEDDDQSDGARAANAQSDESDAEKKSEVGELIADIFGDSDDDAALSDADEAKDEGHSSKRVKEKAAAAVSDSETRDSDDLHQKMVVVSDFVSDFDLMMERRRAENRKRYRKRKDYDIVSDVDDMIKELISEMKHAAKRDNELNREQKPALMKRKLLPTVVKQLKKSDLQSAFIELDVVSVLSDWLSPLPDGSLPALEIRTELLKVLQQFPTLDHQILKTSGIGRAIMILYKHPKEIKENKERAGKLINEWARPIFSLQSDYRSLTKEERIQRDYEHMPLAKKRRMSSLDAENKPKNDAAQEEVTLRPGDKGWIGRARVPQPSTKDYVVRPKWNNESEFRKGTSKRGASLMERKIREIKERTKPKKTMRAVGVSIEGRKMMS